MYHVLQDLFTFWDLEKGIEERTLYDWQNFTFSPDGRFIGAILDTGGGDAGPLKVFDPITWKGIKEMNVQTSGLWFTPPAFSPNGELLAAYTPDGILLWETDTWKLLNTLPVDQPAGMAFSPEGHYLLTFTQHEPPQIWGVE
jgi:WD40 repeat protein